MTHFEKLSFCSGGNLKNKNGTGAMTTAKYEVFFFGGVGGRGWYTGGKCFYVGGGNEQIFG